jgi:8-oxo-dGTP pyrophosphatase MutT (NUDIX family)
MRNHGTPRSKRQQVTRGPPNPAVKRAVRVQYGALPYRFTHDAELEILLLTTRQSKRWIIPKGWPIKGLRPAKAAAREAFEEAGVRGRVRAKSVGFFAYDKILDENGARVSCEVRVFPLLVKRQSETWPEIEQRVVQWVAPDKALTLIEEPELKALVAAFAKRLAVAVSKSTL